MEKREPLCIVGGNKIGIATMENDVEAPQKIKNKTTMRSNNPTSEYTS